jgi:hypothetical protein
MPTTPSPNGRFRCYLMARLSAHLSTAIARTHVFRRSPSGGDGGGPDRSMTGPRPGNLFGFPRNTLALALLALLIDAVTAATVGCYW